MRIIKLPSTKKELLTLLDKSTNKLWNTPGWECTKIVNLTRKISAIQYIIEEMDKQGVTNAQEIKKV